MNRNGKGEKDGKTDGISKTVTRTIFGEQSFYEYTRNPRKTAGRINAAAEGTASFNNNGFGRGFLDRARDDRQGTKHSLAVDSDGFALSG